MKIAIINGPNLNLLGTREIDIYGGQFFDDFLGELKSDFPDVEFDFFQSNIEGELVNALHDFSKNNDVIILNGGAFTHTSIALGDAVAAIKTPVVEVHISNIAARENFRQSSYISKNAAGVIFGFGLEGYRMAVEWGRRNL